MQDLFHQNTKLVGLIGHPIKQSYSPYIHNVAFRLLGLEYLYLPFDVPHSGLKDALKGMVSLDIKGFNVTLPHKENIISLLHNISDEASTIGSVNTIVNDHGKLFGYNTDVFGFVESLQPFKDEICGTEVSVIGAGGAARAAIYSLIRHFKPTKINIINRTEQRAELLKHYFFEKMKFEEIDYYELFPPDIVGVLSQSKLIINATNVGMYPEIDDTPISISKSFNCNQIVFDMVYNPSKTKLMALAEVEGATVINGIRMLVYQAAKAFELWTGQEFPVEQVNDAMIKYLEN